jgi:hypothetical protein
MDPPTEDKPVNDEQQQEDVPEDMTEEIITEPVIDKPPFVAPKRKHKENLHAYRARTEYFRKLYDGERVSEYSMRRYGTNPDK